MSLWSRLFGGKEGPAKNPPETHEGFTIYPEPINEGSRWRVSARIEKQIGGELKSHRLIRADTFQSLEEAVSASRAKAVQMIDEQGVRLFN